MKAATFVVVLVLMVLTLILTLVAILFQLGFRNDLLQLSQLLFSWQVVGAGAAIAGVSTFKGEIKRLLERVAQHKA